MSENRDHKGSFTLRLKPEIEDRVMIHARRGKHTPTAALKILIEEALDARDLLAAKEEGGVK